MLEALALASNATDKPVAIEVNDAVTGGHANVVAACGPI
jgi:hypothetical protein